MNPIIGVTIDQIKTKLLYSIDYSIIPVPDFSLYFDALCSWIIQMDSIALLCYWIHFYVYV